MEITLDAIKPYLRFVRYMHVDTATSYAPFIPYDARLFYTLDGEGTIEACGRDYPMRRGDLIIINSGVDYHIKTPATSVDYLAINFDFTFDAFTQSTPIPPTVIADFDRQKLVSHVSFTDVPDMSEVLYVSGATSLEKRLVSIEQEFAQRLYLYELRISALLTDVLVQCCRHRTMNGGSGIDREVAAQIISYVRDHLHHALSNAEIAEHFHYHPNYVSSLIRRYTGHPLHQYLKSLRIARAADLLATTETPVGEIARLCGFYDISHLTRCFKQTTAMTPKQYRASYQS